MTAAKQSSLLRLLRGRLLYIFLGVLVAGLYAGIMPVTVPRHHEPSKVRTENEPMGWWPKELDAHALQAAVTKEPALGFLLSAVMVLLVGFGAGGMLFLGWALATGRFRAVWGQASHRLPAWSFGELGRILLLTMLVASLLPFLSAAWGPTWPAAHWTTTSG